MPGPNPEDFGAIPDTGPSLNPADFGAVPIGESQPKASPRARSRTLTNDNPNVIDKWILQNFGSALAKMPDIQGSRDARVIQGAADLPVGAMQLLGNLLGQGDKINPIIADMNARTEQLRGPDAGFDWARLAGNMLNPAPYKAAGALPTAAGVGGRMVQGAALGAGMGATSPVVNEGDYFGDKGKQVLAGSLIGGAIPGITGAISAGARGVRNFVDPWTSGGLDRAAGRTLNTAAGDRRDSVVQELMKAQKLVPGSAPTAAEVAAPAGSAEFSGLQRAAQTKRPSEYVAIDSGNEGARRAAVSGIARDDKALADAISQRATTAARNYGAAAKDVVKPDAEFSAILQKPSIQKVISRAAELAKEKGDEFMLGKNVPEQVINGKIVSESGNALTRQVIPEQKATFPVNSLHYMKMAMDDLIKNPERFGIGATEARAIGETQKQLVAWIGTKSPAYDIARDTFRQQSAPINRMEVGKVLESALAKPVGSGERPTAFASAVNNAPQTLKRATGTPRYEKLEQILTGKEMQAVKGAVDDLARTAEHERLAQAGATKASELVGLITPKLPAGGMFNPKYSVTRAIVNRFSGLAEGKSLDRMAAAMETPEGALRVMQAAGVPQQKIDSVVKALMKRAGNNAAINAAIPQQGEK